VVKRDQAQLVVDGDGTLACILMHVKATFTARP
jgi:hypothetical protein